MGYMTTVTFLNDCFDQIENNPADFVDSISRGMNGTNRFGERKVICDFGIGYHGKGIEITRSHHADEPRMYFVHENMMTTFGALNDELDLAIRKDILKKAKAMIKAEEARIKELEGK